MPDDKKNLEAENEALRKKVQSLKNELEGRYIDFLYEEKSELNDLFLKHFGRRPRNGGGAILRWELQQEIITEFYKEKEGDLEEFTNRFSMRKGLTKKKLSEGYIMPLYELRIIKVFLGKDQRDKWQWNFSETKTETKK
jgi:hypothetical protein